MQHTTLALTSWWPPDLPLTMPVGGYFKATWRGGLAAPTHWIWPRRCWIHGSSILADLLRFDYPAWLISVKYQHHNNLWYLEHVYASLQRSCMELDCLQYCGCSIEAQPYFGRKDFQWKMIRVINADDFLLVYNNVFDHFNLDIRLMAHRRLSFLAYSQILLPSTYRHSLFLPLSQKFVSR